MLKPYLRVDDINFNDYSQLKELILYYSPWIKDMDRHFIINDLDKALGDIRHPALQEILVTMRLINEAFHEFIHVMATRKFMMKWGDNIPYYSRYHLYQPLWPNSQQYDDLNKPLELIKKESKNLKLIIERVSGLKFIDKEYSQEVYGTEKNQATIYIQRSGLLQTPEPVVYIRPERNYDIGDMLHEVLAWFYITNGFQRHQFPVDNKKLKEAKSDLQNRFFLLEALFENIDILEHIPSI
jgi:hypothetical protein